MVIKLFISSLIVINSILPAMAETVNKIPLNDTADTQLHPDTMAAPVVPEDPKEGFKNLFTSEAEDGYSYTQLHPMALSFVEDYIVKNEKSMLDLKGSGKPYFDMMDGILSSHGLPRELKYLAVIESQLKTNARSWAGAVGPWQFMPATARTMGLKVNSRVDERKDLYKSSIAASKYLTSLYKIYGDWLLVIAAYNGGPGKVNSAIKRSGSRDFWTLQRYLPLESRNHVKKFIATHYIMEGTGGITTLSKIQAAEVLSDMAAGLNTGDNTGTASDGTAVAVVKPITGRYNASVITRHIAMDLADFNKINPNFNKMVADYGKYDLRLPQDKMDLFFAKKQDILQESVQLLLNL